MRFPRWQSLNSGPRGYFDRFIRASAALFSKAIERPQEFDASLVTSEFPDGVSES